MRSFDQRIPPSIFVSDRDHRRHNQPMPLAERCIEDHPNSAQRHLDDVDPSQAEVGAPLPGPAA